MFDERGRGRAVCRAASWVFAVAVAILPLAASAQPQLSANTGVGTAAAPKLVDLSTVPQVSASALKEMAARPQPQRPRNGLSDQQYAALKAAAAARRFDIPNVKPLSPPATPAAGSTADGVLTPAATTAFGGDFETESCSLAKPSDMGLAVGDGTPIGAFGSPAAVLEVTNFCISVFDKAGNLQPLFPKSINSLLGLPASAFVFDPRALYDWVNHRYIVLFVEFDGNVGTYWVAVSRGDDPTGAYYVYNINSPTFGTSVFLDFPRLGQDRQAIYVASNVSNSAQTVYQGEEWLLLPKQTMYAGQALASFNSFSGHNISGTLLDSTQPANIWGLTDNPRAEFWVGSLNINFGGGLCSAGCNGLVVWAVSNPLGAVPEISGVLVDLTGITYFLPPPAVQLGAAATIDTGDVRITGEVSYAAGSLYAALTTANGVGGAGIILYRIQPVLDDGNPACSVMFACADITNANILNETFLTYGGTISAFYPTQQPDPEGNVTTVFNYSGPINDGSIVYISTRVTQAPGTFRPGDGGIFLASGLNTYEQGRWGDYTGVAPSGINGNAPTPQMWFAGMYTGGGHNWRTKIGKNGFTAPTQP